MSLSSVITAMEMLECGVERTGLIEMWAYFLGREYAHRRYGPNAHSSLPAFSFSNTTTFANSWYAWNENSGNFNTLFEAGNHIAAGFLHDIRDDSTYNRQHSLTENPNIVIDSIHGYTIGGIYNQLGGGTNTAAMLINKLATVMPSGAGNRLKNYNALRSYYGY
ncbi:hypothetical protein [Niabella drilacis]|uniref:Uncharacterized protein n=1 Tax=Niabella drilacis (strain DSM 25811 / CCM 8410 / CCUG 62505 / LMG 26954 / E90) TaxID=1285928 RepID=A0A1G7BJY8_NIADE|nr:hypothetical protein [Niabella drilacis]SDE26595.1 hypothetical protein SAMN04487894_1305 [Niabella drilacis]